MVRCLSCNAENRDGARFCDSCGAPLAAAAAAREVRKTVTVLFCDVSGSTALGERLDPETLRRVLARYFETAKAVVERHGGTVEKFIGDAVMAVFGVPTVHEDDALRAVRAADELRTSLAELNEELVESYGTRVELRIGVNTGEVVTGTAERLATGDAVNLAARLEQTAQPGEVLLGEDTWRLLLDAVKVDAVEPLELKGKAVPVQTYRLVAVRPGAGAIARRRQAPMVGRERQRKLLADSFASVADERACYLFTVLGTAGVGKSRLVAEFLSDVEGATVARGRCLPYGEGISYWPVTEVLKQLLGADPEARLGELGLDGASATALASILGSEDASASAGEIAWAVRKLFEACAAERPLVVVFDDIHWGETAFLDLVEHVADLSRDAPILLLCIARPELLDLRPAWGGGKLNATNVLLEPLGQAQADELIAQLLPAREIGEGLRARILETAGGNPLFVEEMVAMAAERQADGGAVEISVPPTIQALLASRLDQLEPAEREVLEHGSVEGQVFHRGALLALAPEEPRVDGHLVKLVRKDLVRPEQAVLPDDEAYRFRHLLIRDAAYDALPKATRAELHERFATWLAEHGADLVELDEVLGYHLEQAYLYRRDLGPLDRSAEGLARRAAEHLFASGRRAHERGDLPAARSLLVRCRALSTWGDALHLSTLLELGTLLIEAGEWNEALSCVDEATAAAIETNDERFQMRAELARVELGVHSDREFTLATASKQVERAAAALERLEDDEGLARALRLLANFRAWNGQTAEAERIWEQSRQHAERSGRSSVAGEILFWLAWATWWGPTPVMEGVQRCDEIMARSAGRLVVEATSLVMRGALRAVGGDLAGGRADAAAGRSTLYELGHRMYWAGTAMVAGDIELLAGDAKAAEALFRGGYDVMRESLQTGYISTMAGMLATAALEQGRLEDALRFCDEAEQSAAADDFEPHGRQRCVRARVLARLGDLEGAEQAIREARAIVEPTDYLTLRAYAALSLAEVERAAGRIEREREALEEAVRLSELKGDVVTAASARAAIEAIGPAASAAP